MKSNYQKKVFSSSPVFKILMLMVFSLCFIKVAQQSALADEGGYDISTYNVDISIGENNVYHVTETIIADFHEPRHGIYRTIPYKLLLLWEEGDTSKEYTYSTSINSIKVQNFDFHLSRQDGNVNIKIGDAEEYVSGKVVYKISYDHFLGNDKIKSQDFVYYNLIGTEWNCNIDDVSFNVTLPKDFDQDKIEFYSGVNLSRNLAPVQYTVNNNTISGSLNNGLNPYSGLTIKIDLPQGYFNPSMAFSWNLVFIPAAIIFSVLSLIFLLKHGLDPALVKTVEFYPPNNMTPAEAGYIIDSIVDDKDVISLIVYWASKGYIIIDQIKQNDFTLIKLKDLDITHSEYEKYMFNKLFDNRDSVLVSGLKNSFYKTIKETSNKISEEFTQENKKLFTPKSEKLHSLASLFSFTLFFSTVLYMLNSFTTFSINGLFNAFILIVLSLMLSAVMRVPFLMFTSTIKKINSIKQFGIVKSFIVDTIFLVAVLGGYIYAAYLYMSLTTGIIIAIASILINLLGAFIDKRSDFGNEMLGKLLGFKNFLKVAEKPRIEQLVEQNPTYFYDVLPYAYVLGVTDKWSEKFEGIAMRPPEWYRNGYNRGAFSPHLFQHSLFMSLGHMKTDMTSQPSSNGSHGGSGGGFSGGGFGGGGGGSW